MNSRLLLLKLVEFAKVGRWVTDAFLGFAKLSAILIAALKMGEAHENLGSCSLEFLSNYKMMACSVEFLLNCKKIYPSLNALA